MDARYSYWSTDLIIKECNKIAKDYNITFQYSTPTYFAEQLKKEADTSGQGEEYWPEISDTDFLPYSQKNNIYWTGYYTSRAGLKK